MARTPLRPQPEGPPRQTFLLENTRDNHDKYYKIEVWSIPGSPLAWVKATYGRRNSSASTCDYKELLAHEVTQLRDSKFTKGYHQVGVPNATATPSAPQRTSAQDLATLISAVCNSHEPFQSISAVKAYVNADAARTNRVAARFNSVLEDMLRPVGTEMPWPLSFPYIRIGDDLVRVPWRTETGDVLVGFDAIAEAVTSLRRFRRTRHELNDGDVLRELFGSRNIPMHSEALVRIGLIWGIARSRLPSVCFALPAVALALSPNSINAPVRIIVNTDLAPTVASLLDFD